MDQAQFRLWARYIQDISGIFLGPAKSYLIESRLTPLLRECNCRTLVDLYRKSRTDESKVIEKKIIDQMVTNETFFFRDGHPFELLKFKILPELFERKTRLMFSKGPIPIRIWSAGCASGQETYSIAMLLAEMLGDSVMYQPTILGTDISNKAIVKAEGGMYNQFEMDRGLTHEQMVQFFDPIEERWKIKNGIRAMVAFKKMNLMHPVDGLGVFDIIFCRNVMIYFTTADRIKLFKYIASVLAVDGSLIVGSTESLSGIAPQFESRTYHGTISYQLKRNPE